MFILLFADDLTLPTSTVTEFQRRMNALSVATKRLGLTVNFEKSKVMVLRKGAFWMLKKDASGRSKS